MVRKVLILCSANMCRSPMAEGYLKKLLDEKNIDDVRVRSAALYYQGGNPATEGAIEIGKKNGFDLEDHESEFMDDYLFNWADEILIMSFDHYRYIDSTYPGEAAGKVHLLGSFDPIYEYANPSSSQEIMDPYGRGAGDYVSVFAQIKRSIDVWFNERISKEADIK